MNPLIIAGIIIAIIALIILYLIFPSLRRHPDRELINGSFIAHRGLHKLADGIPENSLAAFEAAVRKGYTIENDIHLTRDGEVVVFHDDTLKRMCGVEGDVEDMTLAQLKELRLGDTDQQIPTLKECLDLVDGRVALLIEFKCRSIKCEPLCVATDKILSQYEGKYFVQSFYPPVLNWYKKHRPEICRGQLSAGFYKEPRIDKKLLGCLLFNFMSRPDFVSYCHDNAGNLWRKLATMLGALPVGWTIGSQQKLDKAKKQFKAYIFEDFIPH